MRHVLFAFLSVGILILAFHQRIENGAADALVMAGALPAMLYLMMNASHVVMGFSYIKHRKYTRIRGKE
jgi:hypothetical protein